MGIQIERSYPIIGGISAAALYVVGVHFQLGIPPRNFENLIGACISFFGVVGGFLTTALSLLLALQEYRAVKTLREIPLGETTYYANLLDYIIFAGGTCYAAALASAVGLSIDSSWAGRWHPYLIAAWLGISLTAILASWRVVHLFGVVLRFDRKD